MKKSVKTILAIVAVVALVATLSVCFAACGENPSEYPNGIINVGCTVFEPMYYKDGNTEMGFDYELAQAVFKNLGYKANFKVIEWSNKYTSLDSGEVNCLWNGFTRNASDDGKARSERVDFSYDYMNNKQVVVYKNDAYKDFTIDQFKGKKASYEVGSAGQTYWEENFMISSEKEAVGQKDQVKALVEVQSGAVDYAIVDSLLAARKCGKEGFKDIKVSTKIVNDDVEKYAIGFKKGDTLKDKVNAELVKLAADGTIAKIAAKYGLTDVVITDYVSQAQNA